jgi:hypothetical protein
MQHSTTNFPTVWRAANCLPLGFQKMGGSDKIRTRRCYKVYKIRCRFRRSDDTCELLELWKACGSCQEQHVFFIKSTEAA